MWNDAFRTSIWNSGSSIWMIFIKLWVFEWVCTYAMPMKYKKKHVMWCDLFCFCFILCRNWKLYDWDVKMSQLWNKQTQVVKKIKSGRFTVYDSIKDQQSPWHMHTHTHEHGRRKCKRKAEFRIEMKMEKKWNAIVQEEAIGNGQYNDIAILRLQIKKHTWNGVQFVWRWIFADKPMKLCDNWTNIRSNCSSSLHLFRFSFYSKQTIINFSSFSFFYFLSFFFESSFSIVTIANPHSF